MTLKEYYDLSGGDYEKTLARMKNERMIRRFLDLFWKDDSFSKLEEALHAGEDEAAFAAVHTLKGNALNVGLDRLGASASAMTEALRYGKKENLEQLYQQVCEDYDTAVKNFRQLD